MEDTREGKLYFPFFKLAKRWKGPLGRGVSTNVFSDCSLKFSATFNAFCADNHGGPVRDVCRLLYKNTSLPGQI